jgi:hypothetical protein
VKSHVLEAVKFIIENCPITGCSLSPTLLSYLINEKNYDMLLIFLNEKLMYKFPTNDEYI